MADFLRFAVAEIYFACGNGFQSLELVAQNTIKVMTASGGAAAGTIIYRVLKPTKDDAQPVTSESSTHDLGGEPLQNVEGAPLGTAAIESPDIMRPVYLREMCAADVLDVVPRTLRLPTCDSDEYPSPMSFDATPAEESHTIGSIIPTPIVDALLPELSDSPSNHHMPANSQRVGVFISLIFFAICTTCYALWKRSRRAQDSVHGTASAASGTRNKDFQVAKDRVDEKDAAEASHLKENGTDAQEDRANETRGSTHIVPDDILPAVNLSPALGVNGADHTTEEAADVRVGKVANVPVKIAEDARIQAAKGVHVERIGTARAEKVDDALNAKADDTQNAKADDALDKKVDAAPTQQIAVDLIQPAHRTSPARVRDEHARDAHSQPVDAALDEKVVHTEGGNASPALGQGALDPPSEQAINALVLNVLNALGGPNPGVLPELGSQVPVDDARGVQSTNRLDVREPTDTFEKQHVGELGQQHLGVPAEKVEDGGDEGSADVPGPEEVEDARPPDIEALVTATPKAKAVAEAIATPESLGALDRRHVDATAQGSQDTNNPQIDDAPAAPVANAPAAMAKDGSVEHAANVGDDQAISAPDKQDEDVRAPKVIDVAAEQAPGNRSPDVDAFAIASALAPDQKPVQLAKEQTIGELEGQASRSKDQDTRPKDQGRDADADEKAARAPAERPENAEAPVGPANDGEGPSIAGPTIMTSNSATSVAHVLNTPNEQVDLALAEPTTNAPGKQVADVPVELTDNEHDAGVLANPNAARFVDQAGDVPAEHANEDHPAFANHDPVVDDEPATDPPEQQAEDAPAPDKHVPDKEADSVLVKHVGRELIESHVNDGDEGAKQVDNGLEDQATEAPDEATHNLEGAAEGEISAQAPPNAPTAPFARKTEERAEPVTNAPLKKADEGRVWNKMASMIPRLSTHEEQVDDAPDGPAITAIVKDTSNFLNKEPVDEPVERSEDAPAAKDEILHAGKSTDASYEQDVNAQNEQDFDTPTVLDTKLPVQQALNDHAVDIAVRKTPAHGERAAESPVRQTANATAVEERVWKRSAAALEDQAIDVLGERSVNARIEDVPVPRAEGRRFLDIETPAAQDAPIERVDYEQQKTDTLEIKASEVVHEEQPPGVSDRQTVDATATKAEGLTADHAVDGTCDVAGTTSAHFPASDHRASFGLEEHGVSPPHKQTAQVPVSKDADPTKQTTQRPESVIFASVIATAVAHTEQASNTTERKVNDSEVGNQAAIDASTDEAGDATDEQGVDALNTPSAKRSVAQADELPTEKDQDGPVVDSAKFASHELGVYLEEAMAVVKVVDALGEHVNKARNKNIEQEANRERERVKLDTKDLRAKQADHALDDEPEDAPFEETLNALESQVLNVILENFADELGRMGLNAPDQHHNHDEAPEVAFAGRRDGQPLHQPTDDEVVFPPFRVHMEEGDGTPNEKVVGASGEDAIVHASATVAAQQTGKISAIIVVGMSPPLVVDPHAADEGDAARTSLETPEPSRHVAEAECTLLEQAADTPVVPAADAREHPVDDPPDGRVDDTVDAIPVETPAGKHEDLPDAHETNVENPSGPVVADYAQKLPPSGSPLHENAIPCAATVPHVSNVRPALGVRASSISMPTLPADLSSAPPPAQTPSLAHADPSTSSMTMHGQDLPHALAPAHTPARCASVTLNTALPTSTKIPRPANFVQSQVARNRETRDAEGLREANRDREVEPTLGTTQPSAQDVSSAPTKSADLLAVVAQAASSAPSDAAADVAAHGVMILTTMPLPNAPESAYTYSSARAKDPAQQIISAHGDPDAGPSGAAQNARELDSAQDSLKPKGAPEAVEDATTHEEALARNDDIATQKRWTGAAERHEDDADDAEAQEGDAVAPANEAVPDAGDVHGDDLTRGVAGAVGEEDATPHDDTGDKGMQAQGEAPREEDPAPRGKDLNAADGDAHVGDQEVVDAPTGATGEARVIEDEQVTVARHEAPQVAPHQAAALAPTQDLARVLEEAPPPPAPTEVPAVAPIHDRATPAAAPDPPPAAAHPPIPARNYVPAPAPARHRPLKRRRPLPEEHPPPLTPSIQQQPAPFKRSEKTKRTPPAPAFDPTQGFAPSPSLDLAIISGPLTEGVTGALPVLGLKLDCNDNGVDQAVAGEVINKSAAIDEASELVGAMAKTIIKGQGAVHKALKFSGFNAGQDDEARVLDGSQAQSPPLSRLAAPPLDAHESFIDQDGGAFSTKPSQGNADSSGATGSGSSPNTSREPDTNSTALPSRPSAHLTSSSASSTSPAEPDGAAGSPDEPSSAPTKVDRKGKGRAIALPEDDEISWPSFEHVFAPSSGTNFQSIPSSVAEHDRRMKMQMRGKDARHASSSRRTMSMDG